MSGMSSMSLHTDVAAVKQGCCLHRDPSWRSERTASDSAPPARGELLITFLFSPALSPPPQKLVTVIQPLDKGKAFFRLLTVKRED